MWIIDKANRQQVRSLTTGEVELLEKFVEDALGGQAAERANALLRGIRRDHQWLGCNCAKPMPVLHVALLDTGKLSLKNNQHGALHRATCVFRHENTSGKNEKRASSNTLDPIDPSSHIALHSEFSETSRGEVGKISRSSASRTERSQNRLIALLWSLCESAGLTAWSPVQRKTVSEQFAALRAASKRYTLSPGIPMEAYLDTRMTKQRLVAMSKRLRESKQFGHHRRVGLLLDVLDSVQGREVTLFDGDTVDFFGHLERQHRLSSPLLALATVTASRAHSNFYELGHIAALPVLSKTELFPVMNAEDRAYVAEIFRLLEWLFKARAIEVSALRRLSALPGEESLELRSRHLILHVDLATTALSEGEIPPVTMPETLRLCDYPSLDDFKKVIVKRFIGAANG